MKLSTKISIIFCEIFYNREYNDIVMKIKQHKLNTYFYNSTENDTLFLAIQAGEDRAFLKHNGVHFRGVVRAVWIFLLTRRIQGASTIEQQLVRVLRRRYELTISRKFSEILIAIALGNILKKQEFLDFYMDVAYFGWKGNGIQEICARLDLNINRLSIDDACTLAALLKLPMPEMPSSEYRKRLGSGPIK